MCLMSLWAYSHKIITFVSRVVLYFLHFYEQKMSIRATTNPYQHLMFWKSLYIVFVLVLFKGVSKILIVFFPCGCFSHSHRCVMRIGYFLSLKFEIIKYCAKCRKIDCLLSSWYTEIWIRNTFENFIHTLNISWTCQSSPHVHVHVSKN